MNLILPYVQQPVVAAVHHGPALNRRSHLWELRLACGHHAEREWRRSKLPPGVVRCYQCPRTPGRRVNDLSVTMPDPPAALD